MAGTREGGIKASQTIKQRFGEDFYREQGREGGKAKVPKGFAKMDKKKLRALSSKAGQIVPRNMGG